MKSDPSVDWPRSLKSRTGSPRPEERRVWRQRWPRRDWRDGQGNVNWWRSLQLGLLFYNRFRVFIRTLLNFPGKSSTQSYWSDQVFSRYLGVEKGLLAGLTLSLVREDLRLGLTGLSVSCRDCFLSVVESFRLTFLRISLKLSGLSIWDSLNTECYQRKKALYRDVMSDWPIIACIRLEQTPRRNNILDSGKGQLLSLCPEARQ